VGMLVRACLLFVATTAVTVGTAMAGTTGNAAEPLDRPMGQARETSGLQIGQTVTIANRRFLVIDALAAVGRIPHRTVKTLASLLRLCRAANAYGFAATGPVDVGVVAWIPTNLADCWASGDVEGGGPGETDSPSPCLQGFRTPDLRLYVVFAGSSARVCSRISTQTPGGWQVTTRYASDGLPAGSEVRVKCQTWHQGAIWDYVAKSAPRLPASKAAYWLPDAQLPTGYDWLPYVPRCSGMRFVW
jgi:hypothetical protein